MKLPSRLRALYASRDGIAGYAGLAVARSAIDAFGSGVLAIVIARGLGAEALGAYIYAATVGALVFALGSLSITPVLAREVARRPDDVRRLASAALQLRSYLILPLNVAAITIIALLLPMTAPTRLVTVLLSVAVGLGLITDVTFGLFQATNRFRVPLAITSLYKVATLVVTITLISRGGGLVDIASVVVTLQAGQLLLALGLVRGLITPIDWWPRPGSWRHLAAESSPLAVASLADTISNRADIFILGLLRPVSDVGIYGAAYNIYIAANVVVTAVQVALLPAFARSPDETFPRLWRRSAVAVCAFGVLIGSLFVLFPSGLVYLAYGGTLVTAAEPLRILGPAVAVSVMERLMLTTLISRGWQRGALYATIPSAVTNVALNFIVVPRYTYNGAAMATLGSEFVALFIATFLVCWKVPSLRTRSARI